MIMEREQLIFEVPSDQDGVRIDKALSSVAENLSRSFIQKLIDEDHVFVNGEVCREKKRQVMAEDVVTVELPAPVVPEIIPQDIPLDVVYEDDDVTVVNKSAGMVVHPAPGNPD